MKELKKKIAGIIGNALVNHGAQAPGDIADNILSLISKKDDGSKVPCSDRVMLPLWKEVNSKFSKCEGLNDLENFIYNCEPPERVEARKFRRLLKNALKCDRAT